MRGVHGEGWKVVVATSHQHSLSLLTQDPSLMHITLGPRAHFCWSPSGFPLAADSENAPWRSEGGAAQSSMRGRLKVHLGLWTSALLLAMLVSMGRLPYRPIHRPLAPARKETGVLLLLMFSVGSMPRLPDPGRGSLFCGSLSGPSFPYKDCLSFPDLGRGPGDGGSHNCAHLR